LRLDLEWMKSFLSLYTYEYISVELRVKSRSRLCCIDIQFISNGDALLCLILIILALMNVIVSFSNADAMAYLPPTY
jgi:hypothetical protein